MKKWPVIRHIRALLMILGYTFRAVFIWGIEDETEFKSNPLFKKEREKAFKIWMGEEK